MATDNKYCFRFLTAQGRWVNDNLEVVNPYLISLSKQKRFCPDCNTRTAFRPTLNPNIADEYCPRCFSSVTLHEAPRDMRVPDNIGNYSRIDEVYELPVAPVVIGNAPAPHEPLQKPKPKFTLVK